MKSEKKESRPDSFYRNKRKKTEGFLNDSNHQHCRSLNEIQSGIQCPYYNIDLVRMIVKVLNECTLPQGDDTERRKAIADVLRRQTRTVGNLVQVLDSKTPILSRTYHPTLVDSLIFQTEKLIDIVSEYVYPLLERTNNNKKRLP